MPMMPYAIEHDAMKHDVRGNLTNALEDGLSLTSVPSAKEQMEQQAHMKYLGRMWPGLKKRRNQ